MQDTVYKVTFEHFFFKASMFQPFEMDLVPMETYHCGW